MNQKHSSVIWKYSFVRFIASIVGLLVTVWGSAAGQSIKVAVASNLLLPFQEIEKKFEDRYPYQVEIIPGASGTLTSQIMNGAPYHIFVSADDKYIKELVDKDIAHGGPATLCFGTVYLWVSDVIDGVDPQRIVQSEKVKSIGLAHPDLAPYGKLARDWLELKQLGVLVHDKIVYGNSIGQVNQYIAAKSVDVAFTSNSLKFSKEKAGGRFIEIKEIWMDPVPQSMIMLKTDGAGLFVATLFRDFLQSRQAIKIFEEYGYQTPVGK